MVDAARARHDEGVGAVAVAVVVPHRVTPHGADGGGRTADGATQGVSPWTASWKASWTTSVGLSSAMASSSRMTPRSRSKSAVSSREEVTMSASTSTAMSRSWSSTRAQYSVDSLPVSALDSPPTASKATAMSRSCGVVCP